MSIRLRSILAFAGFVVVFVVGGLLTQSEIVNINGLEFILPLLLAPLFLLGIGTPLSRVIMKSTKWQENEHFQRKWQESYSPFHEWYLGIDKNGQMRK